MLTLESEVERMMYYENQAKLDHIKNYFTLPNEISHFNLSSGAISVYAFLLRCEDRTTFECYPSFSTIGKAVGMSKNTVRKYVKELESAGLIKTEHTTVTLKDGRKRNGNLKYKIMLIKEVVEARFKQQLSKAQFEKALADYDEKHGKQVI